MGRIRPRMRNRRCSNCGHEFAVWIGHSAFKHKTARRIVFLSTVAATIPAVLLCVDLYRLAANPGTSWIRRGADALAALGRSGTERAQTPPGGNQGGTSEAPTDLSRF